MKYGYKLREIRKNQHMGINTLSARSGISNAQISRIERNIYNPKLPTLEKLAKGLNISKNKIFEIAGIEPERDDNSPSSNIDLSNPKNVDLVKVLIAGIKGHQMLTFHNHPVSKVTLQYLLNMLKGSQG